MSRALVDGQPAVRKSHGSAELRPGLGINAEHSPQPFQSARLYIDPQQNVILGGRKIARYLGLTSVNTLWRWQEAYGFPIVKRPDGIMMTTMTAIDQWIFIAAELVEEAKRLGRIKSKGHMAHADSNRATQGDLYGASDLYPNTHGDPNVYEPDHVDHQDNTSSTADYRHNKPKFGSTKGRWTAAKRAAQGTGLIPRSPRRKPHEAAGGAGIVHRNNEANDD